MRFALLTTAAAALLTGTSAQATASGAATMMVAGIDKLAGMAEDATELLGAIDRPNMPDTLPMLVGALTNIANEMETQAEGLRSSGGGDASSSEAPETTPFSAEEQRGVCNSFGHMAEAGDSLLSGLMMVRSLLEGTQFMEPVGVMVTRWGVPFQALFGAFMQLAPDCAEDTVQDAPDVGTRLAEAIEMYAGN